MLNSALCRCPTTVDVHGWQCLFFYYTSVDSKSTIVGEDKSTQSQSVVGHIVFVYIKPSYCLIDLLLAIFYLNLIHKNEQLLASKGSRTLAQANANFFLAHTIWISNCSKWLYINQTCNSQ